MLLYKEQQLDDDEYLIDCGCNADEENCIIAIQVKTDGSIFGIPLETSNIISDFKRRQGLLDDTVDEAINQNELPINIGEANEKDIINNDFESNEESKKENVEKRSMRHIVIENDLSEEIEVPSQKLVDTKIVNRSVGRPKKYKMSEVSTKIIIDKSIMNSVEYLKKLSIECEQGNFDDITQNKVNPETIYKIKGLLKMILPKLDIVIKEDDILRNIFKELENILPRVEGLLVHDVHVGEDNIVKDLCSNDLNANPGHSIFLYDFSIYSTYL